METYLLAQHRARASNLVDFVSTGFDFLSLSPPPLLRSGKVFKKVFLYSRIKFSAETHCCVSSCLKDIFCYKEKKTLTEKILLQRQSDKGFLTFLQQFFMFTVIMQNRLSCTVKQRLMLISLYIKDAVMKRLKRIHSRLVDRKIIDVPQVNSVKYATNWPR